MQKASIRDLRYRFDHVEDLLSRGEEVLITRRKQVIARILPPANAEAPALPDFAARLRRISGSASLKVSHADLLRSERDQS